jgi:hypothetical protein
VVWLAAGQRGCGGRGSPVNENFRAAGGMAATGVSGLGVFRCGSGDLLVELGVVDEGCLGEAAGGLLFGLLRERQRFSPGAPPGWPGAVGSAAGRRRG